MKILLILIPLLSFSKLMSPIHYQEKNDNLIQNTNLDFRNIDFSKFEVNFLQVGCFNHDRYRLNFTKVNDRLYLNVYGYSTIACEKINSQSESQDKLLASRLIKNEDLVNLKSIFVTDQTAKSTMFNKISIKYNGSIYKFYDNNGDPKWKRYIYYVTNNL